MRPAAGLLLAACCAAWSIAAPPRADAVADPPSALTPYTETIPDANVAFDMVPIPAGTFRMGSPPDEAGRDEDEGPQHEVTLPAFYMGRLEVTWAEYDQFAQRLDIRRLRRLGREVPRSGAAAVSRPTPPYADESWGWGKGKQPVIGITHHAAVMYCKWLSEVTGKKYRLPTEAEWEYAARAGTTTAYSFGDDAAALGEYAWYRANADEQPHPGGLKKPNPWGLYDMHGNVAEWTADLYQPSAYAARKPPVLSPLVAPADALYPHVVRGGSWDDDPAELRSAARRASTEAWSRQDPQNPKSLWWHTDATFVGFRVVRELD
ncbi:MAG TPA: formylglycine-generating enzyme family protein [Vicinamibacterales bacterium]|nr:formylglycine-generating enzyme family protein [Vicinamibacterales bacterium]